MNAPEAVVGEWRQDASRVVVHIGLHKTGTTSFQESLRRSRSELALRGIAVQCQSVHLNQLVVRPELDTDWRRWSPFTTLPSFQSRAREVVDSFVTKAPDLLVISDEGLSLARSVEEFQRLKELLAPRQVKIVLVLRDRTNYLSSLRKELSQHWPITGLWPDSFMYLEDDSWHGDFARLIECLRVVFPGFVTVIDYDHEMKSQRTIIPALWEACELPAIVSDQERELVTNTSLGRFNPIDVYGNLGEIEDPNLLRAGWVEALEMARIANEKELASRRLPLPRLKASQTWSRASNLRTQLKRRFGSPQVSRSTPVHYRNDVPE